MKMIILIVSIFSYTLFSCQNSNVSKYIGAYELDRVSSKLGKFENMDSLLDLTLVINKDHTFQFSHDVPFIFMQAGKWEERTITSIDNPPVDKCYFIYVDNMREDVLLPMDEDKNRIYFNFPMAKGNYLNQVEFLCFKRHQ